MLTGRWTKWLSPPLYKLRWRPSTISEKEMAKEAWDALKEMYMGEERIKKTRVQL
jgi:hypothetical protein